MNIYKHPMNLAEDLKQPLRKPQLTALQQISEFPETLPELSSASKKGQDLPFASAIACSTWAFPASEVLWFLACRSAESSQVSCSAGSILQMPSYRSYDEIIYDAQKNNQ